MTLAEAIESFLFHCRYEKNLSPKTLKAYATDLRQFGIFVGERLTDPVGEIDKAVLRSYIQGLYSGLTEKSIKRKVATVKVLFRFLEREDVVLLDPFRKMEVRIREPRRLPRSVPLPDLRRLFEYLYRLKHGCSDPASKIYRTLVRDIAVLEVLFATGARVSEVCNLTVADVDLRLGSVRIFGKGARERIVQLCEAETIAALREYCSLCPPYKDEACFFRNRLGRRLSEQSVRAMLVKYAGQTGLGQRLTPHMLRHSVATLLLEEGADIRHIQQLLGHSSISTTQIYTEVHDLSQRQLLSSKHPRRKLQLRTVDSKFDRPP